MTINPEMGKEDLVAVFKLLDEELAGCPWSDILVAGGASMAFWWDDRRTRDVDAIAEQFPQYLQDAIEIVAERQALHLHWMNNNVIGIRLPIRDVNRTELFRGENLAIYSPDKFYLLAMKLYAHRDKDAKDAFLLAKETEITDARSLEKFLENAYQLRSISEGSRLFISEIVRKIAESGIFR